MLKAFRVLALCAPVVLAGCQVDVLTDVYLSDVLAVRDGSAALPAALQLSFEVPSDVECLKAADNLNGPLSAYFAKATYSGCRKDQFRTFADFDVETEIIAELADGKNDSARPVYVGVFNDDGKFLISVYPNEEALKALFNAIPEEVRRGVTSQSFAVAARIVNDTPAPITISVEYVFVDGAPYLGPAKIELARRGEITVTGSDVANAAFGRGARFSVASID